MITFFIVKPLFRLHPVVFKFFSLVLVLTLSPLEESKIYFVPFILCNCHVHHPCLLAAFDSVGLSTREASRRQYRLDSVNARDIQCHSNNQLLYREESKSAHPSTCARLVLSLFHWVHLEPSSCRLEPSDRASRNCL